MKRSKIFSGYCNSLRWFLMGKNNYKLRKNQANCENIIWWQNKHKSLNKRRLSAEGCSLLPSALRPRLLGILLFQIVATSTIFSYLCSTPVSAASLTLTIPSSFSLDIAPSSGGAFVKSEAKSFNVKTDNAYGYTLSVKAKNSDNSNVLLSGSNKLNSISEQTTEDNFKSDTKFNNTWGFLPNRFNSKNNTNFLPGPTTKESVLDSTEEANETGTDYNIIVGAKVDNAISPGAYSNSFIIQASANAMPVPTTMQGFGDYCKNMDQNQSLTLTDTRDNNTYTVAKLKDGKCWMTQNLRIQDKEISSEDSAMESGTFTIPASDLENFGTERNTPYVYVNTTNKSYGGYYSWHTATAGQSNMVIGGSLDSICPKGWHLPTREDFSNLIANSNYTSSTIKSAPANFTTPGYVNNKKISGSSGNYWSASDYYGDNFYSDEFYVYNNSTKPKTSILARYDGASIRCIASDMEVKNYSIKYDLNGGSGGPSPNKQTGKMIGINGNKVKLSDIAPTKDEDDFMGWCTVNPGTDSLCSGKFYKSGDIYTFSDETDITLYAMWLHIPIAIDKGNLGIMQNFDCDSKLPNIHEYGTVTDSRDNNTYKVAKLKDGKCWMVENLRLGDDNLTNRTLTSTNTDIVDSTYQLVDKTGACTSGGYYDDHLYIDPDYPERGGSYSWYTATAGTGTASVVNEEAPSSICPKGWRLPTGGYDKELENFVKAYGYGSEISTTTVLDNLEATPVPGITYAGGDGDSVGGPCAGKGRGIQAYYSSSTATSSAQRYILYIIHYEPYEIEIKPSYSVYRVGGDSVRCVAR